jgi:long-chain fatty acid transport protein
MRHCVAAFVIGTACTVPSDVYGGAFELRDQGAAVAGNAYAGAAAIAEDASTIFYNPAGMARLSRSEVVLSADALFPTGHFKDQGSFDLTGHTLTGGLGGSQDPALVPSSYLVWAKSSTDWLRFGLGINSPFGLSTEYAKGGGNWVGRYYALDSEVRTYNVNPSISVNVFDWLSIGAGVSAQRMDAKLTNAIDFGSVCFASLGPVVCPAVGLFPQRADGHARFTGNDWGFGYNGGILISPTVNTRLGLAIRSHIDFHLEGDATFKVPQSAAILTAGQTLFQNTGLGAKITVPETATLGFYQRLTPKLAALFGAEWTRWSRVQELRIRFDNSLQPDAVLPADWHDSWFFSVGVNYLYSDRLTLRAGVGYDQSPIPERTRTPRLPGSDTLDLAIGTGYKLYDDVQFDFAYQLVAFRDAGIHLNDPIQGDLNGKFDLLAHVFSVQLRRQF